MQCIATDILEARKQAILENLWHPTHILANSSLVQKHAPALAQDAQAKLLGQAVSSAARPAAAAPRRIPLPGRMLAAGPQGPAKA